MNLFISLFPLGWLVFSDDVRQTTAVPVWQLSADGVLVGCGARLGNGCTSGHGICGMSSLKLPSLLAVLTSMSAAFLTANLAARWLVSRWLPWHRACARNSQQSKG